jgi:hypothetical protein
MAEASPSLEDLIGLVESRAAGEPLDRLQAAVVLAGELGDLSDQLLDHFVTEARGGGCSWAQIGERLGVTKQAAQQRFVPGSGMGPFRVFSADAREAVSAAQDAARGLKHDYVGTEHLLLAVLGLADRPAVAALAARGLTADGARAKIVELVGEGSAEPAGSLRFAPRAKRTIGMAIGGARWMGHREVAPEHLLLAMLRDGRSVGGQVMRELAGDRDETRLQILEGLFGEEEIPNWVREGELPPWMHRRGRGRGRHGC